ncbi:hypothetical protein [Streptomyces sp. NPDC059918]|uniref:hypothetical protein n=1 Tax=unclassified Streptomyces TaxID=2593676 RepID=UPI00365B0D50
MSANASQIIAKLDAANRVQVAVLAHQRPRHEQGSTRVRVRPRFEEALRTAREAKAHAPHCRVTFTVYEMKRPGRGAPELTVLAGHLTAHGPILETLAGLQPRLL